MKDYMRIVIVLLLLLLINIKSFSQRHKDSAAYISKYPVKEGYAYWFKDRSGGPCDLGSVISVYSKDSSVFAVMAGTVKRIFTVDESDFIMIGRRDTMVVYGNMDTLYKKVGDTIHKGDLIGIIEKEPADDRYELLFSLIKGRKIMFWDNQIKFLQHLH